VAQKSGRDADVEVSQEELSDEERQHNLSELCTDFFLLGLQIRGGLIELPPPETLRRRLLSAFEGMRSKAGKAGLHPNDMEDVRYGLAAFLDEMIHYSEWPGREDWAARPLQAIMFNESRAGKHFFDHLAEVRRRSPAALEIYYTCIVLGFQGEYRLTGAEQELDELIEDLRREVTGGPVPKNISVHGRRPEALGMGGRRLPLIPMAIGCLVLGVLGVAALYLILHLSTNGLVEMLTQLGRG
jgi:type VI secretion system protein ImpK